MTPDPWHFPRREFTSKILNLITDGPARALTLFAPRRTGKTELLLKDLGPLAEAEGHRVVYASFWQEPLSPLATLLHALDRSLRSGSFGDRVRSMANTLTPRIRLSASVPGTGLEAGVETDLSVPPQELPPGLLLYLDDLVDRVSRGRKVTLLMLDEVQELARHKDDTPLVAALRTSLDKRSDRLRAVFTGSSRNGLAAMFSAREAPFFHFTTPVDLPALGEPFVEYLLDNSRRRAQRTLDRSAMLKAFDTLHMNPHSFRLLIEQMIMDPSLTVESALEQVRFRIADELGYRKTWLKLRPIQRATASALAQGVDKPFSEPGRDTIGAWLGGKDRTPSPSQVQTALRRLQRLDLADPDNGGWRLDDPEFAAWLREHDASRKRGGRAG